MSCISLLQQASTSVSTKSGMLLDKLCIIFLFIIRTMSVSRCCSCFSHNMHVTICMSPCACHTCDSTSCSAFLHFFTYIRTTMMVVICCQLYMCRDDLFTSMLPKYHDILRHEADLDILVFSGDVDGIVPVIGTRRWLASLQLPILKEWRPWYSHTGESGLRKVEVVNDPGMYLVLW